MILSEGLLTVSLSFSVFLFYLLRHVEMFFIMMQLVTFKDLLIMFLFCIYLFLMHILEPFQAEFFRSAFIIVMHVFV